MKMDEILCRECQTFHFIGLCFCHMCKQLHHKIAWKGVNLENSPVNNVFKSLELFCQMLGLKKAKIRMTTFKAEYGKDSFNISVLLQYHWHLQNGISYLFTNEKNSGLLWGLATGEAHYSQVWCYLLLSNNWRWSSEHLPFSFLGCPTLC